MADPPRAAIGRQRGHRPAADGPNALHEAVESSRNAPRLPPGASGGPSTFHASSGDAGGVSAGARERDDEDAKIRALLGGHRCNCPVYPDRDGCECSDSQEGMACVGSHREQPLTSYSASHMVDSRNLVPSKTSSDVHMDFIEETLSGEVTSNASVSGSTSSPSTSSSHQEPLPGLPSVICKAPCMMTPSEAALAGTCTGLRAHVCGAGRSGGGGAPGTLSLWDGPCRGATPPPTPPAPDEAWGICCNCARKEYESDAEF